MNNYFQKQIRYCFRLVRLTQQRNRFIADDLDTDLTISQSAILTEVSAGAHSMAELITIIGLDQSSVSRHISSLVEKKLIKATASKTDARQKILTVTARGVALLTKYSKSSDLILDQFLKFLTPQEATNIVNFFKRMADNLDAVALKPSIGDKPIHIEMRRYTFAVGLLSSSFLGSGMNVGAWQVLSEIAYNPFGANSQKSLAHTFGMPATTISSIIKRLEADRFITITPSEVDGRETIIRCTNLGSQKVAEIEDRYCAILERALRGIPSDELDSLLKTFELFVGMTPEGKIYIDREHVLDLIRDPLILNDVRILAAREILNDSSCKSFPSMLLHPNNICWAVYNGNKLLCVGEYIQKLDTLECLNIVWFTPCSEKIKGNIYDTANDFIASTAIAI